MLADAIAKWVELITEREVVRRLCDPAGPNISVSVAIKLASGRYHSEIGFEKGQAILREMAKDGLKFQDGDVA